MCTTQLQLSRTFHRHPLKTCMCTCFPEQFVNLLPNQASCLFKLLKKQNKTYTLKRFPLKTEHKSKGVMVLLLNTYFYHLKELFIHCDRHIESIQNTLKSRSHRVLSILVQQMLIIPYCPQDSSGGFTTMLLLTRQFQVEKRFEFLKSSGYCFQSPFAQ